MRGQFFQALFVGLRFLGSGRLDFSDLSTGCLDYGFSVGFWTGLFLDLDLKSFHWIRTL
jgi:hypothetical protein